MKKTTILFLTLLLLIYSCQRSHQSPQNQQDNSVELSFKEVKLNIDSLTLPTYNMLSTMIDSNKNELIVAYNYKTHTLDLIDYSKDSIAHIVLSAEGNNGITPSIKGLYAQSADSIWLFNNNTFYLVNQSGSVRWKYTIPSGAVDGYIVTDSNYSIATMNIYFNAKRNSLFFTSLENSLFYENELCTDDKRIKKYLLNKSTLLDKQPVMYGWKQMPNITYNNNLIIYNYPIESKTYTIDILSGKKEVYETESKFTENTANQLVGDATFENMERHKIENIHFFEVIYNRNFNCYYRLHLDKGNYDQKSDLLQLYLNKDIYLTVFDENFKVINESKLNNNRYYYLNGWVNSKEGLILLEREQNTTNLSHEELKFDIISTLQQKSH